MTWYGAFQKHYLLCLLSAEESANHLMQRGCLVIDHVGTARYYKRILKMCDQRSQDGCIEDGDLEADVGCAADVLQDAEEAQSVGDNNLLLVKLTNELDELRQQRDA